MRVIDFSVIVPAHNEELLLPRGLRAIDAAAGHVEGDVQVIVVANRCTDATVDIARSPVPPSSTTSRATSQPFAMPVPGPQRVRS